MRLKCMNLFFIAVLFVQSGSAHKLFKRQTTGCSINLETDLPLYQPLMLKQGATTKDLYSFLLPDLQGNLVLAANAPLRVACAGKSNVIAKLGVADAGATCAGTKSLKMSTGTTLNSIDLNCTGFVAHSAVKSTTEKCEIAGDYVVINIGFQLADGFYPIIKICFDEKNRDAIYSKYLETPSIAGQNVAEQRPAFVEGSFYPEFTVDTKYSKTTQKTTFGQILGSATLGTNYIKDIDYYLARGHLAARSDFIYATQQRATFWYINTAPQWQTFNGGNWNTLEDNLRNFVVRYGREITMYVGTHGLATLPDTNGQQKGLYLHFDPTGATTPKIKVPELFWKVMYDASAKKAVAFVGVNNPYKTSVTKLCTDVCSKLTWLTWQPTNQKLGFAYCCELNDLRKNVPSIPALDATALLV
ncbi:uncharacterized protein LOC132199020 [Neocloeon triangulifer]|uniref:uncharacterized protein LOC132199020 n=1 Tax=Neocloeon triangulifer TaxID=2078957 RepID=UPI00286EBFF6|nr:uncharacterized protein LOC132199020 [Neocloeon triangulifer]